jgi:pilus assembly protein Flp/PilA
MNHTRRDTVSDTGASAVEYALIVVGIAAVVAAIVFVLGQTVFASYTDSCQKVTNGAGTC